VSQIKKRILNSQQIKKGDTILAIPSSGVHSNGFFISLEKFLKEKKYLTLQKIKTISRSSNPTKTLY